MGRRRRNKRSKSKLGPRPDTHAQRSMASQFQKDEVSQTRRASSVEFEIAPGGLLSGCAFFFLAGGLLLFSSLSGMMLMADPQALGPKFFGMLFGVLGLIFTYMALDAAVREGTIAIRDGVLKVHEKRLGWSRKLQKPLREVYEITVAASNVSVNRRTIRELNVATTQGNSRFFRYIPDHDLNTLANEMQTILQEAKRLEASVAIPKPLSPQPGEFATVTRPYPTQAGTNRTVANFLLACIPIVILLGLGSLISFLASIHTLELTRIDDTHVRFSGKQKILSVVGMTSKTIEDIASVTAARSGNHSAMMTITGTTGAATVPGSDSIAAEMEAFINDSTQQTAQFHVGNPLAECAAWVFAAFGLFILTCVAVDTTAPICGWWRAPPTLVDLEYAPQCLARTSNQFPIAVFVGQIPWLRITHWKAGERVQLSSSRPLYMTLGGCVLLASMSFYPIHLFFGYYLRKLASGLPWGAEYFPVVVSLLPGTCLGYFFVTTLLPSRRVSFDFALSRVCWRSGHRRGSSRMQDLKRVAMRTVRERFGGSAESPTYRCRIDIEVGRNEFITILDTERVSDSYRHAEMAIAQIEPFARALATTLQLPLTKPKKPIDTPRLFEMLVRDQKPVLVTVALISGSAVSLIGFQLYRGFVDRALVRQAGGSVSGYSYGVGGRTILAHGRLYDFSDSDSELTDEKFSVIAPIILRDRQPIALDLSGTAISDASVALLKGASRIRILDVEGCQVGDAAASSIGNMQGLMYLTLTNTKITDIGLESLSHLSSLQYVYLGDDRRSPISNRGLKHLGELRHLRDLYLHNTQVTEEAVAELQARLPTVEVRIPEF